MGDPDDEIEQVLGLVGRFLGCDRCALFLLEEDGTRHRVSHVWTGKEVAPDREFEGTVVQEVLPWLGQKMRRHENIVIHTLDDLPAGTDPERDYAESRGIRSFLICPMRSRELVVGNIGLDMVRQQRTWNEEDSTRLRLLGEVLGPDCRLVSLVKTFVNLAAPVNKFHCK